MANKNDICCEKGLPYKYCCIKNELRKRDLVLVLDEQKKLGVKIDMTNDLINMASTIELPLKYFCKDHEFYFFGVLTVGECEILHEKLKSGELIKQDILDAYKKTLHQEGTTATFQSAIDEYAVFKKRESQIKKVLKAHYNGDYELTIPVLFTILEGILREEGELKNSDTFKPTIPIKVWEQSGMYFVEDDARNFNHFIHKLFEGGRDEETFNRNPILHGFNVTYYSEEHSLLLILALMEIRLFNFWKKELNKFPDHALDAIKRMLSGKDIKIGDKFSFTAITEYKAEIIKI